MARSESDGNRRGTMATASCEKSTRPHDARVDHGTSHGDRPRSRWSPVASLLIVAAASSAPGPQGPSRSAARARRSSRPPASASISATGTGGGGDESGREMRANLRGGEAAAAFRRTCAACGGIMASYSSNSQRRCSSRVALLGWES
jgi:hypothetical protein